MTAVMRAVAAPAGPRILRVGVLRHGLMVDERLIRDRGDVTVGPGARATFVAECERDVVLFERAGGGYQLNGARGMRGRVALESGVRELPEGEEFRVRLDDRARGKVIVGDTTFLFQFVAPPPLQPRPQLPIAVKKGIAEIDWLTTIIAAFSFLLHFFAVALVYSDWHDPVAPDEDAVVTALVESVRSLPPPPIAEKHRSDVPPDAAATATVRNTAPTAKVTLHGKGPISPNAENAPQTAKQDENARNDAKADGLVSTLKRLDVDTLVAIGGDGVATDIVLGNSEVPAILLDEAARRDEGVNNGDPYALKAQHSGKGETGPLAAKDDISTRGEHGRSEDADSAVDQGKTKTQKVPKVDTSVSVADPAGEVPGANGVIARMKGRFRNCYMGGLDSHPDMQGSTVVFAKIGPNGEVLGVSGGGGPLAPIGGCLRAVVQSGSFSPPKSGASVTLAIPISFFLGR